MSLTRLIDPLDGECPTALHLDQWREPMQRELRFGHPGRPQRLPAKHHPRALIGLLRTELHFSRLTIRFRSHHLTQFYLALFSSYRNGAADDRLAPTRLD